MECFHGGDVDDALHGLGLVDAAPQQTLRVLARLRIGVAEAGQESRLAGHARALGAARGRAAGLRLQGRRAFAPAVRAAAAGAAGAAGAATGALAVAATVAAPRVAAVAAALRPAAVAAQAPGAAAALTLSPAATLTSPPAAALTLPPAAAPDLRPSRGARRSAPGGPSLERIFFCR